MKKIVNILENASRKLGLKFSDKEDIIKKILPEINYKDDKVRNDFYDLLFNHAKKVIFDKSNY